MLEEIPSVSEATGDEVMQIVSEAFDNKPAADRLWRTIEAYQSMAAANKAAAEAATIRQRSCEFSVQCLKDELLRQLQARDMKQYATSLGKFSRRGNGGLKPLIIPEGVKAEQLPEQFQKVKLEINTDEIRRVLEEGEELDFAAIGERGEHLRLQV